VLILNLVKVLCFDTLLQVLILKVVKVVGFGIFAILRKGRQIGIFTPTGHRGADLRDTPHPGVLAKEAASS
jgi:hypothetical protein